MDFFFNLLPTIFCYFSGLLVVWGLSVCCSNISSLKIFKKRNSRLRKYDIIPSIGILSITAFILLNLFIFPQYLQYYIELMFIAEIWYAVFLSLCTIQTLQNKKRIFELSRKAELTNSLN